MIKLLALVALLVASASAQISQPVDFSITTSGPHHVTAGHYFFFLSLATLTPTSGPNESATPVLIGLPIGAVASYPNLIKFCCTDHLYTLTDSLPIRIDTLPTTLPGIYPLTLTYTAVSGVVRSVPFTLSVDATPPTPLVAKFPTDVPLAGLAMWEANMKQYGTLHCIPSELATYEGFVWYYDGTRVYYQIADYTKDPKWITCAKNLDTFFANYINSNNGNVQGWRNFPHGLGMGFKREGIAADRTAVLALRDNNYGTIQNIASQPDSVISWLLSREVSYGVNDHVVAEQIGELRLPALQDNVELLLGHFSQWFLDHNAAYTQPFMVALAAEALIGYESLTHDPRILPTLQRAADELWNTSWDAASLSFLYYNYDASMGPPPPQPYPYDGQCSNRTSFSATCKGPAPDLNLLIAPLYGWVYQHTGNPLYRTHGDMIFNSGVNGAWLIGGKQFSQNYRWSDRYVAWRKAPLGPLQPSTGATLYCVNGTAVLTTGQQLSCVVQQVKP